MKKYTINEVHELAHQAAKSISDNQSVVWSMPEWNICHHLAIELAKAFEGFDVDVELMKDDRRRPDIVIHRRGNNEDNLVVFQVKVRPSTADVAEDIAKINETFFREPYSYKYGVFISVGKLPSSLPEFDKDKIRFVGVHGWRRMTDEEIARKSAPPAL